MTDVAPPTTVLEARLGTTVSAEVLERALTHRSYAYENGGLPTNERLEFLGDSVLGLVVTDALYRTPPRPARGPARQAARRGRQHARAGRRRRAALGLGAFVRLGRGEEATGGRDKSSILADTVEAVIGAVYLDRGLDAASGSCTGWSTRCIDAAADLGAGLDWKTSLQELTAGLGLGVPEYVVDRERPRPREDLRRRRARRRRGLRRRRGPQQEGGRAGGRRGRLDGAARAVGRRASTRTATGRRALGAAAG